MINEMYWWERLVDLDNEPALVSDSTLNRVRFGQVEVLEFEQEVGIGSQGVPEKGIPSRKVGEIFFFCHPSHFYLNASLKRVINVLYIGAASLHLGKLINYNSQVPVEAFEIERRSKFFQRAVELKGPNVEVQEDELYTRGRKDEFFRSYTHEGRIQKYQSVNQLLFYWREEKKKLFFQLSKGNKVCFCLLAEEQKFVRSS
ncbi:hypothetical protein RFI_05236 [Reticulomyxa filosa]|uniref:Uncharacterized protein n=1 Tax=Reticulomyxa filosa TaxID=46433 RepID=X6P007_RETFI|nr:hypothetical protein RFI_05236 [Reticulomyxa filosa]|eukprot:ETO31885.1 hypothetical protein RFI_05236 [Reticulomyxa filosa]